MKASSGPRPPRPAFPKPQANCLLCCIGQVHSFSKPVCETALGDVNFFRLLENWGDTGQMYPLAKCAVPSLGPISILQLFTQ